MDIVWSLVEESECGHIGEILSTYEREEDAQDVLNVINKLSYHATVKIIKQRITKKKKRQVNEEEAII